MRFIPFLVAVSFTAVACSRDLTANSPPPTSDTTSSTNGLNIAADSALANQTAVVGAVIVGKVHVTRAGQPVAGIAVSWIAPPGGGSVSPASSNSDASGVATTSWTLGDTARVYTLTAATSNGSAALQATAIAGPATTLTKVGTDTVAVAGGASALLTVRSADKLGNPVGGVVVAWTTTGGAITAASTTTGASGKAEVVFSSDPAPKTYTVTATAAGLGTQTFVIVAQ
jgi:Bacterial Ig-like domain (group 1)